MTLLVNAWRERRNMLASTANTMLIDISIFFNGWLFYVYFSKNVLFFSICHLFIFSLKNGRKFIALFEDFPNATGRTATDIIIAYL